MQNKFRVLGYICLFLSLSIQNSFAQITVDKDGTVHVISTYEAPSKENNKKDNDRPAGPYPSPVEDRRDGKGNGNNGGGGNGKESDGNSKDNKVSPQDSKSDTKFNDIIDKSSGREHSGEAGEYAGERKGKSKDYSSGENSSGRESENYYEIISKGKAAKQVTTQEKFSKREWRQQTKLYLAPLINGQTLPPIQNVYNNNEDLFSPQKVGRIDGILTSIKNSFLTMSPQNIVDASSQFAKAKEGLYQKELQSLLRSKNGNSIQATIRAEKVMENWKLIENIIGDATFSDIFIDVKSATKIILDSVRLNQLPPSDQRIYSLLKEAQSKALFRFYEYTRSISENQPNFVMGPEQFKTVCDDLNQSLVDLTAGNYLSAAANLTKAKTGLKDTAPPFETAIGPLELADFAAGIVLGVTEGIAKIGSKKILEKITTIEERNLTRLAIQKVQTEKIVVYVSVEDDIVKYTGITNNIARRAVEHLRTKGIIIDEFIAVNSRYDARAVEQALIEINGLIKNGGSLLNKINSISPKNQNYKEQLKRGYEILKAHGYYE